MTARYPARRAVQAETRFPLKVAPNFPLARSLREPSPGLGLGRLPAVRPQRAGRKRQREIMLCKVHNSVFSLMHQLEGRTRPYFCIVPAIN